MARTVLISNSHFFKFKEDCDKSEDVSTGSFTILTAKQMLLLQCVLLNDFATLHASFRQYLDFLGAFQLRAFQGVTPRYHVGRKRKQCPSFCVCHPEASCRQAAQNPGSKRTGCPGCAAGEAEDSIGNLNPPPRRKPYPSIPCLFFVGSFLVCDPHKM